MPSLYGYTPSLPFSFILWLFSPRWPSVYCRRPLRCVTFKLNPGLYAGNRLSGPTFFFFSTYIQALGYKIPFQDFPAILKISAKLVNKCRISSRPISLQVICTFMAEPWGSQPCREEPIKAFMVNASFRCLKWPAVSLEQMENLPVRFIPFEQNFGVAQIKCSYLGLVFIAWSPSANRFI